MPGPVRIEVMHGVNLNMLGRREPEHYGTLTLDELERQIEGFAAELGVEARFFRTNFEGEYVEHLHNLGELVDAVVLNPGAWTHYAWAIHDALLTAGLPAVEVHLSDLGAREPWRQLSVIEGLCIASFTGEGPRGYHRALERLRDHLGAGAGAGPVAGGAGRGGIDAVGAEGGGGDAGGGGSAGTRGGGQAA